MDSWVAGQFLVVCGGRPSTRLFLLFLYLSPGLAGLHPLVFIASRCVSQLLHYWLGGELNCTMLKTVLVIQKIWCLPRAKWAFWPRVVAVLVFGSCLPAFDSYCSLNTRAKKAHFAPLAHNILLISYTRLHELVHYCNWLLTSADL